MKSRSVYRVAPLKMPRFEFQDKADADTFTFTISGVDPGSVMQKLVMEICASTEKHFRRGFQRFVCFPA